MKILDDYANWLRKIKPEWVGDVLAVSSFFTFILLIVAAFVVNFAVFYGVPSILLILYCLYVAIFKQEKYK